MARTSACRLITAKCFLMNVSQRTDSDSELIHLEMTSVSERLRPLLVFLLQSGWNSAIIPILARTCALASSSEGDEFMVSSRKVAVAAKSVFARQRHRSQELEKARRNASEWYHKAYIQKNAS